ncbi:hypothetical protein [Leucobacter musarum]|uniref:hypothetical protein n=1 Tax=Leucobacter musarum TaxID=1930747 RepID=UPI0006A7B5C2|nr:hypothetical protein [Leucobacter musarum]
MNLFKRRQLQRSLEWLKSVAGLDDAYLQKWTLAEWSAWKASMDAGPDADNPSVPAWMRPLIRGMWHNDFSYPFPQVAQLITAHPWFMEAMRHDDFSLRVIEPETGRHATLAQIERAEFEAADRGWETLVSMFIEPTSTPGVVVGAIEAFYVIAPAVASEDVCDVLEDIDLPNPTQTLCGRAQSLGALLKAARRIAPHGEQVVWASEWMYE